MINWSENERQRRAEELERRREQQRRELSKVIEAKRRQAVDRALDNLRGMRIE